MHPDDISELSAIQICHDCVGEQFLSQEMATTGEDGKCEFCDEVKPSWTLGQLADRIETAFDDHYIRTADQPDSWEERMQADRESSYEWYRQGMPTVDAIQDAAEIEQEAAEYVQVILDDKYSYHDPSDMDGESEFSTECHYDLKGTSDVTWQENWHSFEQSIQTEARFFSRNAAALLSQVFNNIDLLNTKNEQPLVVNAGPQWPLKHLYRARVFQSEDPLLKALCRPDQELGPPPARLATAGRMNAQGISVFYGATSMESAIAEVRPPVGSRVVVAKFNVLRDLRLLDLTALEHAYDSGSIFDTTLKDRLERVAFLQSVGKRMTRPVMPDDQALDYLATQAVADFLATENEPSLDGIVFQSAQAQEGCNVVLFHKASKVEALMLPEDTKISASSGYGTEDGYEIDYLVREAVPKTIQKDSPECIEQIHPFLLEPTDFQSLDPRQNTLGVDPDSVEVSFVKWVEVHCSSFKVNRYRLEQPTQGDNDF